MESSAVWADFEKRFDALARMFDTNGDAPQQLSRLKATAGETLWYEHQAGRLPFLELVYPAPETGITRGSTEQIMLWSSLWRLVAFHGEPLTFNGSVWVPQIIAKSVSSFEDGATAEVDLQPWQEYARNSAGFCRWLAASAASMEEANGGAKIAGPQEDLPQVTFEPLQIVIDTKAYAISESAAHYLQVLIQHYGERLSDKDAIQDSEFLGITYSKRPRLKEVRESLPQQVLRWIDCNNSGTKLRRPV